MWAVVLLLASVSGAAAQPAVEPLNAAYAALRSKEYDRAISLFEQALREAPGNSAARQDLAYTYIKVGEPMLARDQFAEALGREPANTRVALEYAFLCNETGRRREARRIFDRIRREGDPASRATAEKAFRNIDAPLQEGIERWSRALAAGSDTYSTHFELATLAEDRDELELAARHYRRAWECRPGSRGVLVALGRVLAAMGKSEDAMAALLAASRGGQPRAAEDARALLPSRYPYVYEFRRALDLDPSSVELRRELAYLLLRMGRSGEALKEFRVIVERAPSDLLSAAQLGFLYLGRGDRDAAMPVLDRVLNGNDQELANRVRAVLRQPQAKTARTPSAAEAKMMADRSMKAGYLKDALRYLLMAQEADPLDFPVMLRLGWTYNLLRDDRSAARWFSLARRSPDRAVAAEAGQAWRNLRPGISRVNFSAWAFPLYSSRWNDLFSYGQFKAEVRTGIPLRPYLSVRFIGDARRAVDAPYGAPSALPQYLSESSFILGVGVTTPSWHGLRGWAEAGSAVSYRNGHLLPDYRGGFSFNRAFGHLLFSESRGWFVEGSADGVYISRFDRDSLLYLQLRAGYSFHPGPLRLQLYWLGNTTTDQKQENWANFSENGPGFRLHASPFPKNSFFTLDALRGSYFSGAGNTQGPGFQDIRAGFWYAFSY